MFDKCDENGFVSSLKKVAQILTPETISLILEADTILQEMNAVKDIAIIKAEESATSASTANNAKTTAIEQASIAIIKAEEVCYICKYCEQCKDHGN